MAINIRKNDTVEVVAGDHRGARGKVLHLELVRPAFTEPYLDGDEAIDRRLRIVSETLRHAPWEEL